MIARIDKYNQYIIKMVAKTIGRTSEFMEEKRKYRGRIMEIQIIRSNRKTMAIEVNFDLSVIVRAPWYASQEEIERVLQEKEAWIHKHMEQIKQKKKQYEEMPVEKLTQDELKTLADKAREVIPGRVEYFATRIGVTYGRITIRSQKTRWGSCSSKGNLNFNCLLMLTPSEILDYVVVHELCHRKQMNHSKAFWREVEKEFPDYKNAVKWLKEEGGRIMWRLE